MSIQTKLLPPILSVALAWPTAVLAAPPPAEKSEPAAKAEEKPAEEGEPAEKAEPSEKSEPAAKAEEKPAEKGEPAAKPAEKGEPEKAAAEKSGAEAKPEEKAAEKGEPDPNAGEKGGATAATTAAEPSDDPADLEAALERASAARKAKPTAANWKKEGAALERAGRLSEAAAAYRSALEALPDDAKPAQREALEADLARVQARARGTVAGEPDSTHRAKLDARWQTGKAPAAAAVKPPPPPPAGPQDRIINKWYLWVTVGAILASAVAVTIISVNASRETRDDSLSVAGDGPIPGFRF